MDCYKRILGGIRHKQRNVCTGGIVYSIFHTSDIRALRMEKGGLKLTVDDVKAILRNVRLVEEQIDVNLEDLARLREQSIKITSVISDMPRSTGNQDKIGTIMAKIIDMESELLKRINTKKKARADAEALIDLLDNPRHKMFLYRWYFLGQQRSLVADSYFYSRRSGYRLHDRLLETIAGRVKD